MCHHTWQSGDIISCSQNLLSTSARDYGPEWQYLFPNSWENAQNLSKPFKFTSETVNRLNVARLRKGLASERKGLKIGSRNRLAHWLRRQWAKGGPRQRLEKYFEFPGFRTVISQFTYQIMIFQPAAGVKNSRLLGYFTILSFSDKVWFRCRRILIFVEYFLLGFMYFLFSKNIIYSEYVQKRWFRRKLQFLFST